MSVYTWPRFNISIRQILCRQRDVGAKSLDAVSKRNLENDLRTKGLSWRDAKIAVSIFADWSKSGALRDVEATPGHAAHREDARDGVFHTSHRISGTSNKE